MIDCVMWFIKKSKKVHGVLCIYCITGIIRGRKVLRITFFAIVHEKTFVIQTISYINILAKLKSAKSIDFANASRFAKFANFFFCR